MVLKISRFVAVMLAALTLGLGFCHLMQLPSRLGWDQYLWVGSTLQGGLYNLFGSIGALIDVATVIALALLAYFVRERGRPGFRLALAAALLLALALALWWVLVYPVNVELAKWVNGPVPSDWTDYRSRWDGGMQLFRFWSSPASPRSSPPCLPTRERRFAKSRLQCLCP
jgi:hypothetical protein